MTIIDRALKTNQDARMLPEELELIQHYANKYYKGGNTLEIGAYKGMTSFLFASIVAEFEDKHTDSKHYIVDEFDTPGENKDVEWGYQEHTRQMLIDNLHEFAEHADVFQGFSTANGTVEHILDRNYDYIFIDGDHRYGTLFLELMMADAVTDHIMLHDYGHNGVVRAVNKFLEVTGYKLNKWEGNNGLADIIK